MNPALGRLHTYPFERIAALLASVTPALDLKPISLAIGEPKHAAPPFVLKALAENLHQLGSYPATRGLPVLRQAMAAALTRRCLSGGAPLDPERMVLPVNGTREGLFAIVQAVIDPARAPVVAMPNPCYQIYEGAAILAGAEPHYMNTTAATGFLPDLEAVPAAIWERCQLLILCSPGNPTGAVMSLDYLRRALELANRYDFVIAADECYIDLYLDEARPPPSLLEAARLSGHPEFERCLVFHSLSKRSSVPGLRSGLVAGDPALIRQFLLYRTYHGCAMSVPVQLASVPAWEDEEHVRLNRALYREKFAQVLPILQPLLEVPTPHGAFYLWPDIAGDDALFTRELFERQHLMIVPGSYLARDTASGNPGRGRVRISLVPSVAECVEAAERIGQYLLNRRAR
jgi:N-succinyldiaminopimelate aminotransferase